MAANGPGFPGTWITLPIGIPATYIPDQNLRLRLYRRLANILDEGELDALRIEFADRFGEPPDMVVNLFFQIIFDIIKFAGAAYLIYLGLKLIFQKKAGG